MVTVSTSRHRSKRSLSSCCLKIIPPFVSLLSLFKVVAVQYYYAWNSSNKNIVQLNDLAGNPSNADVQVYHQEEEGNIIMMIMARMAMIMKKKIRNEDYCQSVNILGLSKTLTVSTTSILIRGRIRGISWNHG